MWDVQMKRNDERREWLLSHDGFRDWGRGFRRFVDNPNVNYDSAHEIVLYVEDADVIISQTAIEPDKHCPVIDIDIDHQYYPSSTPGHGHLYIDKALTWKEYKRLLKALVRAGIVEEGYYKAALSRGYTSVRLPWIKKVF